MTPDSEAVVLRPPGQATGMVRALDGLPYLDAMAALHEAMAARRGPAVGGRYLEIGVDRGHSLALARGAALGIDPVLRIDQPVWAHKTALHLFQCDSDAFFRAQNPRALLGGGIDLAFIDGMHHAEYALRDLINTERHMAADGAILLHDCLPWSFAATRRLARRGEGYEPVVGGWAGDTWKLLALVQEQRPDMKVMILDCPPTGLVVLSGLNAGSDVLWAGYGKLAERIVGALATEDAFRGWLGRQRVTSSRAWAAAGCPV